MTWWQWLLLVAATLALLASNALRIEARDTMWTIPRARAHRWAFFWLVLAGWCLVFGVGILP